MEGIQKAFRSVKAQDPKLATISSTLEKASPSFNSTAAGGPSSSLSSSDNSQILLTRPPRHAVSLWTCSKLCTICFVAGIIFGYTLRRRVRRWGAKLLRRLKDD